MYIFNDLAHCPFNSYDFQKLIKIKQKFDNKITN